MLAIDADRRVVEDMPAVPTAEVTALIQEIKKRCGANIRILVDGAAIDVEALTRAAATVVDVESMTRAASVVLLCAVALGAVAQPAKPPANRNVRYGMPSPAKADPVASPNDYLLERPQYVMSYNEKRHSANWVCWHLTKADIGNVARGAFEEDPELPKEFKRVQHGTYSGSGFDRGHLCPSKDRSKTEKDNESTPHFYFESAADRMFPDRARQVENTATFPCNEPNNGDSRRNTYKAVLIGATLYAADSASQTVWRTSGGAWVAHATWPPTTYAEALAGTGPDDLWIGGTDLYHYSGGGAFDPAQAPTRAAAAGQRVIKGGSFLCAPSYCMRYRAGARQAQESDLAASHVGFRTVLNAPGP